jgi:hypothetical protein
LDGRTVYWNRAETFSMATNALSLVFAFLASVVVISIGSYIGALRALEVYHGDETSMFLRDERRRR